MGAGLALAMAALSACGMQQPGQEANADSVAVPVSKAPRQDPEVAFMEMTQVVGAKCVPDPAAEDTEDTEDDGPAPGEHPPTAPVEPLPVESGAPTSLPSSPSETLALSAVERCEGDEHAARITHALKGLGKPSTTLVKQELNKLGYVSSRIHSLKAKGAGVSFLVDLRLMGGQLALKGTAAAAETKVSAYAHHAGGAFDGS